MIGLCKLNNSRNDHSTEAGFFALLCRKLFVLICLKIDKGTNFCLSYSMVIIMNTGTCDNNMFRTFYRTREARY